MQLKFIEIKKPKNQLNLLILWYQLQDLTVIDSWIMIRTTLFKKKQEIFATFVHVLFVSVDWKLFSRNMMKTLQYLYCWYFFSVFSCMPVKHSS